MVNEGVKVTLQILLGDLGSIACIPKVYVKEVASKIRLPLFYGLYQKNKHLS
jgi:hypothetical protein